MSYDLCTVRRAEKPYLIENIQLRIYSLEELCYYLYHNISLIDESLVNETLCRWIRDELGLSRLYRALHDQLERGEDMARFVMAVFRELQYLSPEEMRKFQDRIVRLEGQPEEVRGKLRADYLASCGMYGKAIREYGKILNHKHKGKLGAPFYAEIWNNLGSAHAGLFRYKNTADCYWNAWKLTGSRDYLRKYISTLPLFLPEDECKDQMSALGEDTAFLKSVLEQNAKLCARSGAGEKAAAFLAGDRESALRSLREAYSRSAAINTSL